MAEQIEKQFGIKPTLIRSHGGVFEVSAGNDLIFSKKKMGRFPEPGEVEKVIEARKASSQPA